MPESKIICPKCGGHVAFPKEIAGQAATCPHCQEPIILGPKPRALLWTTIGVGFVCAVAGSATLFWHMGRGTTSHVLRPIGETTTIPQSQERASVGQVEVPMSSNSGGTQVAPSIDAKLEAEPTKKRIPNEEGLGGTVLEDARKIIAAVGQTEQASIKLSAAVGFIREAEAEKDLAVAQSQTQAKLGAIEGNRTYAARRGTPFASTNPVDMTLARHQNSNLTVEKAINWIPAKTNRFDLPNLGYTLVLTVDPAGFEFTSYQRWTDMAKAKFGDQDRLRDQGHMKFRCGQETNASQTFSKFLEWEAIASKENAYPFEKPLARYPEPGSLLIRTFSFRWDSAKYHYVDRSVDQRASLLVGTEAKEDHDNAWSSFEEITNYFDADMDAVAYGLDFWGVFNKVEITNFQELMKSLPDLKQELAEKLKRQDAQTNLFK